MSSFPRRMQRRSAHSRVAWARKFIKENGNNPELGAVANAVIRAHVRPQYAEPLPPLASASPMRS